MSQIENEINKINAELNANSKLIAVSKTKPIAMINEAYNIGQRHFGENKVQDLLEKSNQLENLKGIQWHFIGHLQTNKINQLLKVKNLKYIHSIDRLSLLEKLIQKDIKDSIGLFLQVNTSLETEKSGFTDLNQLNEAIKLIDNSQCFYLKGLMTIGKIRSDNFENDAHICFKKLRDLKLEIEENHKLKLELSMGMSSDYKIACEYGANWIRIGTQIFGTR